MNGPGIVVAAPPLRPPVVGLLQAAQVVDHAADDTHWFAGLRWKPADNAALDKIKACAASYALTDTNTGLTTDVDNTEPFELIAHDTCSAFGWSAQDYEARARESLLAKEWGDLEREFEQGTLITANARLAQNVATLTTTPAGSTAIPAKNALAALDEAIANARIGQGMIHAPAYVVALWVGSQVVKMEDVTDESTGMPTRKPALFSPNHNLIVAGSGYQGASTAGAVDGTHATLWTYATDLIVVHREAEVTITPDTLAQAMDRTLNNVTYRASRVYAVEWSRLLHAAVPVAAGYAT
jgi:hypothetical protein